MPIPHSSQPPSLFPFSQSPPTHPPPQIPPYPLPQVLVEAVGQRVGEADVLATALQHGQRLALVARRLQQPVDDAGQPEDDVHDRIRVEEQHALDLALDLVRLAAGVGGDGGEGEVFGCCDGCGCGCEHGRRRRLGEERVDDCGRGGGRGWEGVGAEFSGVVVGDGCGGGVERGWAGGLVVAGVDGAGLFWEMWRRGGFGSLRACVRERCCQYSVPLDIFTTKVFRIGHQRSIPFSVLGR